MKKILLGLVLLLAVMSSNAQVQSLKSVSYRGAFAPAPTAMWTDGWANWDPKNTVYPTTNVTVNSNITTNTTWTKSNTYKLSGLVYVTNGATLTIEAGTIIRGDDATANSSLVITQGAKVYAVGTADAPIVFTSNKAVGSRNPGDWGGVIVLGKAPINTAAGTNNIEGIAATSNTLYGGTDDNDNSGTLKYVRVEFGGYVFQPNQEINGFTFGGVGRGTTIDYLQSSFINDDAYEWFGGTVNCSHLISYRGVDDEFDTDNGFSGTVQFCLGVRDPNIGDPSYAATTTPASTSEGFESDNDATGSANTPNTKAIFSNITLIGPLRGDASTTNLNAIHPAFRRSARIRRNSQLKVINSLLMDYPRGLFVDDNGTVKTTANASAGTMIFANNILAGNKAGTVIESGNPWSVTTTYATVYAWFAASNNDSVVNSNGILANPYNFTSPDFRPATGSIALSGASFSNSAISPYVITETTNKNVLQKVDYRGAFAPAPTVMWTNGWANWDPKNTAYPTANVTVNSNITSNTTWTKNNTYKLSGLVYVTNNATLTIEAGTIIRGDDAVANSSLVITQGAKLNAVGTELAPIVFTSNKAVGSRNPGDWGGVILLGKAKINTASGTNNIEGIAATSNTLYGGTDDNDNSGTLKYVRVEFGGYVFQPNQEINGFTFGGVGRGTTLDYLQSSFINDDAFEFFGGTVNAKHLISYRGVDDEFDTDNGFSGTVQFALGVRDPNIGDPSYAATTTPASTSEGFESDNDATGSANSPYTSAIFSNVTLIGPLRGDASTTNLNAIHPAFRRSARIRRNSRLRVLNSLLLDYPRGLFVDDNGTVKTTAAASSGSMRFSNNLIAGNKAGNVIEPGNPWSVATTYASVYAWFAASKNDSLVSSIGILTNPYPTDFLNPDFRPGTGSIALQNYNFADTIFNNVLKTASDLSVPTSYSSVISGDTTYNDVTLSGGTLTINAGKTLTINGTLSLNSGTIVNNGGTIVYGGSPITVPAGSSVNFSGTFGNNIINNGTINLTDNSTFAGNVTNNGIITGAGSYLTAKKLTLTGSNVNVNGNGSIGVLEINSNGTITNSSADSLKILNKLILTKGVLASNGKITLKSTSLDSTAVVDVVTNGSVSGNVVAERCIPAGFRAYRDLAPGINTNGGTIFNNWQEGGAKTSGYGIFILGAKGTTGTVDAATGFDFSNKAGGSVFTYRAGAWSTYSTAATNFTKSGTLSNLDYHFGWRVLVNGDRNFNVDNVTPYFMFNKTVLRATGTLVTGNVNYLPTTHLNTGLSTFSLIGNPYLAPIDWDAVGNDNSLANAKLTSAYYFITRDDSTDKANGVKGSISFYATYDAFFGSSVNGLNSRFVMPGQAIFVQNDGSGATGTFTIKESHKAADNSRKQQGIFGQSVKNNIYVALLKKTTFGYEKADQVKLVVAKSITANRGVNKLNNASDNLTIVEGGKEFSIAGYRNVAENDTINLSVAKLTAGASYQIAVNASEFNVEGATPYLLDRTTNTVTEIKGNETIVTFTASTEARFAIVFSNKAVIASIAKVALYPNPVVGNTLHITTSNLVAGKYNVVVYNTLGKKVYASQIDGSLSNHDLNVALASGHYKMVVMNAEGKVVNNTSLQVK